MVDVYQGCSLGLDVLVSRRNFKRLGLMDYVGGLGLDLVSDLKSNGLISDVNVLFTSRPTNIFHIVF